jgi:serine/threonine protein kinase
MTTFFEPAVSADEAGDREPGRLLHGTYRIQQRVAAGGMGEIYLAIHERLPGRYAIKMPHRHLRSQPEALARFKAEAHLLATLRHPNIVQVIDCNVAPDGMPYLVMELVEGAHLRQHLSAEGPFAPARVAGIVGQIASALQLAHDSGVVHCDLKLENVMLTSTAGRPDQVKLLDFGIACTLGTRPATGEDVIRGTPQFMAPEQIVGADGGIDDRADQFALACLAYTLLTGRAPFFAEDPIAVLYRVVHDQPEPLENRLGPAYRAVSRVLERALDKNPDARFATVSELAETLRRATEDARRHRPLELVQDDRALSA